MNPTTWSYVNDHKPIRLYQAENHNVSDVSNWSDTENYHLTRHSIEMEKSYIKDVNNLEEDNNKVIERVKNEGRRTCINLDTLGEKNMITVDFTSAVDCTTAYNDNSYEKKEGADKLKCLYDERINHIDDEEIVINGSKCSKVKFSSRKTKKINKSKRNINKEQPSPLSISTSSYSPSSRISSDDSSFEQFAEAQPPDGGWGWVIVAASFMVNLIADGITFSFGVIFVEFLNYFNEGKSKTAWIGSLFMAMPLLSGPVASFLTDRYGCRRVSIAGSILATAGFVFSSFTSSMGVLIFTFGVIAGFGLSLCFVAAVVIVAYYFNKKRSFATGLSVCGSGIGTFIFAPVTQYLLAEYGWRGTTLILAGLFFNLAVCGCLMRDLEWTTVRAKAKSKERKRIREKKRTIKIQCASIDSFSNNFLTDTTPHSMGNSVWVNPIDIDYIRRLHGKDNNAKLFSSLLTLPTFIKNGDQIPLEVLDLLATRKDIYSVFMRNYPQILTSSKSISDSATLCDISTTHQNIHTSSKGPPKFQKQDNTNQSNAVDSLSSTQAVSEGNTNDMAFNVAYLWWLNKFETESHLNQSTNPEAQKRIPSAYLKNVKIHRHSLTYRGAMLNINRYRLKASSCPDIYRNSMTTIAKNKFVWYSGLWEFWDLIVDMLDFSHFTVSKFLLFSISNFLLHTWYDVPYVYLTDNAIEMGFSETDASILISVIGIANMFGEIFLGWAGDKPWANALIVYALCMILCGIVTSLIPMVTKNYYALCSVSGAFGIFIAANYSLTSIILVEVITIERFTNAYGLLLLVQGIANLMGPPLAGWLYDITGTYDLSFYLAGFFIGLSGLLLMVMPLMEFYKKWISSDNCVPKTDFGEINNV
ncbi:monocarboxylate transporter 9-like [Chelonus insularis]|uniref:monocarboxylate transporter 9-like n=1 Tax=Chelonus insularis TaxID=460826 RepID=UPI00158891E7|nr:monocarboxylate transporter 9-like [Chelonus insularis]XP_034935208.1 monocarboxylate transporter 9-like [Chelonus insularis]XP_034935209.1 monocarboxylate transporter 9-like [Chelonus insularis]